MQNLVEKHKKLLLFYGSGLRITGWLLLILGILKYPMLIVLARSFGSQTFGMITSTMPLNSIGFFTFGTLALGIAQFIRYRCDFDSRPGFLLKHSNIIIYAYIAILFILLVLRIIVAMPIALRSEQVNAQILFLSGSVISIVLFYLKALILFGIAQLLKRLIPIMEEHKSLI